MQAKLPNSFWAEAVNTANYIQNRCTTRSLNSGTPYERWTGRKANVNYFRTFGCKVFVSDTTPGKEKFQPRAKEGIFVGYSSESKAYRIWVPAERKIHISRDVKFLDEIPVIHNGDVTGHECADNEYGESRGANSDSDTAIVGRNSRSAESEREGTEENNNDEGNDIDIDDIEDDADADTINISPVPETKRAPGRPKLIRTGRPGRPRKQYATATSNATQDHPSGTERNAIPHEATDVVEEEWFDANMCTAEIPFNKAISGGDKQEWLDGHFGYTKRPNPSSRTIHGTW